MHIGIVTSFFYPRIGGAENYAYKLSIGLIKAGHTVDVFTTDTLIKQPTNEIFEGIKVRRFPSWDPIGSGWCCSPALNSALENADVDILHCHKIDCYPAVAAARVSRIRKIPLLITTHLGLTANRKLLHHLYFPTVGRWTLQQAKVICAVSTDEIARLSKLHCLNPAAQIEIIPSAADDTLHQIVRTIDIGSHGSNPLRVLFVGRLERSQKGIDRLEYIINSSDERLIFTIVGDGDEKERIIKLANRFPQKVHYAGILHNKQLVDAYASSDVFIIPSRLESYPCVIAEALAAGLPVIGSDIPAIRSIISHGINGLLVNEADNPEKWLSSLLTLAENRLLLSDFSVCARDTVSHYTWDSVVNKYMELYLFARKIVYGN